MSVDFLNKLKQFSDLQKKKVEEYDNYKDPTKAFLKVTSVGQELLGIQNRIKKNEQICKNHKQSIERDENYCNKCEEQIKNTKKLIEKKNEKIDNVSTLLKRIKKFWSAIGIEVKTENENENKKESVHLLKFTTNDSQTNQPKEVIITFLNENDKIKILKIQPEDMEVVLWEALPNANPVMDADQFRNYVVKVFKIVNQC